MSAPAARGMGYWLAVAAVVVALGAVIAAVLTMGTPAEQRERRLDQRRISDLTRIVSAIEAHARQARALPATLADVDGQPGMRLPGTDPVTGAAYEYIVTGERSYELCAVFTTDTADAGQRWSPHWAHGAGRHCFQHELPESVRTNR